MAKCKPWSGTTLAKSKIYGFEFLNLTHEQTQRITDRCKCYPLYRGKSLGI